MNRTYANVPEPRYVEKARESNHDANFEERIKALENASGGSTLYKHLVAFQHDIVSDTYGIITIISTRSTAYTAISELSDGVYYANAHADISGDFVDLYSITLRQNTDTDNTEVILIGSYSNSVVYSYQDWAFGDVSLVSDTVSEL